MKAKAAAKINIFLKIRGKRPDGYHDIETIFLPLAEPCDEITISENAGSDKPEISISDDSVPDDENNICFQAAIEFAKYAKISPSWKIHIEKNIPVSAGLGGGSSDAATVLNILDQMYPGMEKDVIFKIACSLGADVPFFLESKPASATGTGEVLTQLADIPKLPLVIVNPRFPVSAAWGYQNFKAEEKSSYMADAITVLQSSDLDQIKLAFCNDLQPAVFKKFPLIRLLKDSLLKAGAIFAGMSGSGPTLFAVCGSPEEAAEIADTISVQFTGSVFCLATSTCASLQK